MLEQPAEAGIGTGNEAITHDEDFDRAGDIRGEYRAVYVVEGAGPSQARPDGSPVAGGSRALQRLAFIGGRRALDRVIRRLGTRQRSRISVVRASWTIGRHANPFWRAR